MTGVDAVRLRFDGPVLPSIRQAVAYGNVLHKAASRHGVGSPTLTGRNGDLARNDGHAHAHYLLLDADDDRLLDTAVVWAPEGLTESDVEALSRIRHLRTGEPGFRPVRIVVEAWGCVGTVAPELGGPSRSWRSSTPFAPYRHQNKRQSTEDFLLVELARERETRGAPAPTEVRIVSGDWLGHRRRRSLREPDARAYGLQISFAEPVFGPLSLGALSHFGLGLFLPVP